MVERSLGRKALSLKSFESMIDITGTDFRNFDLNLLLVFHALMRERSVTRAARRLFIGQPALSGALKRLRLAFADELFVRTSHGMEPTPRAIELARAIDPLLVMLQQAFHQRPSFDPVAAERVFRIGLSDALEVALMPEVMRRIASLAPGVRLISHLTDGRRASDMLDAGEIELAVGVFLEAPSWQRRRALFDWTFVCIYNPQQVKVTGATLSMEQYLAYPHLLTSFNADLHGFIDDQLEKLGHTRRVVLSSRNFATSPLIIRQMEAFTTVPTFVAGAWREALGLSVSKLPFDVPTHVVSLMWTNLNDADAGLAWLMTQFVALFSGKAFV
jgi:LysR family transcriptional regulator, mexEF-oprN operon transcriptional activator